MTALAHRLTHDAAAPFAAAMMTLALGLAAPALALLCVAAVAAFLLMREGAPRIALNPVSLIGPAAAALAVGLIWGWDGAMGVLLVWRIAADAVWSKREAEMLFATASAEPDRRLNALHYFATPALGLACAAYSAPHVLAGLPLDLPHAPLILPLALAAIATFALFDWALRRLAEWRLGALARTAAAHTLAHHILFLSAYVLAPDLSAGFMAMIVWRLMAARYASFTAVP